MKYLILFFGTLIIFLHGCDCYIKQKGRVLSNIDGKPIINARVILKNTSDSVMTDSLGYFDFEYFGGGNCPKPVYLISKAGFKDFEITLDYSDSESIFKVKKGNRNYDLKGKYFYPDSTNLSTFFVDIQFDKYSTDYTIKNDSLILYMDLDDMDVDFADYLKNLDTAGWNIEKWKIK